MLPHTVMRGSIILKKYATVVGRVSDRRESRGQSLLVCSAVITDQETKDYRSPLCTDDCRLVVSSLDLIAVVPLTTLCVCKCMWFCGDRDATIFTWRHTTSKRVSVNRFGPNRSIA